MIIAKALERRALISENRELHRQLEEHHHRFATIVSQSGAMAELLSLVARVAPTRATVLLRGESGTGKELIARAIHDASPRHGKPFIAVNCAALPESLFESEFFGHEKGAFTGADRRRIGRFEEADGGTLFIDEIGDIPLPLQVKLLRTLQDGEFQRVGGNITIRVDVRIVAATNRDLETMIVHGAFREDLYYRLNVVAIQIPPLRERKEDIPLLVEHFIARYATENGKRIDGISKEAMELLMRYDYPGNVRELENAIERAVVVTRGRLMTSDDLPMRIRTGDRPSERQDSSGSLDEMVEALERRAISEALEATGGNQTKAAQRLGITERNLRYKMKKYKLRS
jgi:two-component system NtrC family response regulator